MRSFNHGDWVRVKDSNIVGRIDSTRFHGNNPIRYGFTLPECPTNWYEAAALEPYTEYQQACEVLGEDYFA